MKIEELHKALTETMNEWSEESAKLEEDSCNAMDVAVRRLIWSFALSLSFKLERQMEMKEKKET